MDPLTGRCRRFNTMDRVAWNEKLAEYVERGVTEFHFPASGPYRPRTRCVYEHGQVLIRSGKSDRFPMPILESVIR